VAAHTPIIVTNSGPSVRAQVIAAYQAGAWEYCSQPYDGELLIFKLDSFVRAKLEMDRVRDESLLDQITGLYNARGLARRAREIGAEAYRQHNPLACVAISADVGPDGQSEELMYQTGALLATHFGGVFRRTGRLSDAFGRLGQQEFAIIAPATEAKGAERLVERLQESLAAEPLSLAGGGQHRLTIKAGYCAVPDFAESSVDAVEMLLRAATALRQLRADGSAGSTIRAFDEPSLKYVQ
jgi:diguanylate cyclase (GGDEF)-like protein